MPGSPVPKRLPDPPDLDDAGNYVGSSESAFAPAGQLVLGLPGAIAQLGLDGQAYEPRPEGPSHHLGPDTGFRIGTAPTSPNAVPTTPAELESRLLELVPLRDLRPELAARVQSSKAPETLNNNEALRYWDRDGDGTYETRDLYYVAESVIGHVSSPSTRGSDFFSSENQLSLPLDSFEPSQLELFDSKRRRRSTMVDPSEVNERGYWAGGRNREANCGLYTLKKDGDALLERFSTGKWATRHVVKCGKWTCPECGRERARRAANQLGVCLERFLETPAHSAVMLTKTTPHEIDDDMSWLVEKQFEADAKFRESAEWRAFVRLGAGVGRVRALDVTFGGDNGTHPHFHELAFLADLRIPVGWEADSETLTRQQRRARARAIASKPYDVRCRMELADVAHADKRAAERQQRFDGLLGEYDIDKLLGKPLRAHELETQQAFLDELARPLIRAWERTCDAVGIPIRDRVAFRQHAIELKPCTDAAQYLVKWGLADEVTSTPQKHRSHLRLLDIVGAGDAEGATEQQRHWGRVAAELFRRWRDATVGKTWLTGVADICNRLGVTDDDARAYAERRRLAREAELAAKGEQVIHVPELHLVVPAYLLSSVRKAGGWYDAIKFVEGIERGCPGLDLQEALNAYLWRKLTEREQRDAFVGAELELARLRAPPDTPSSKSCPD